MEYNGIYGISQSNSGYPVISYKSCTVSGTQSQSNNLSEINTITPAVYVCNLVGGAITILKNMKVNGKDYPIYYGK
jgi:hypothetical protein